MNRTKTFLSLFVISAVIVRIATFFIDSKITELSGSSYGDHSSLEFFYKLRNHVPLIPSFIAGIWLFVESPQKKFIRIIWAIFGLTHEVVAVIAFYVIQTYFNQKNRN